jgi:hypothetical protein
VAKEISQECMTKVKNLMGEAPRYKLIFHVCRPALLTRPRLCPAPMLPARNVQAFDTPLTSAQVAITENIRQSLRIASRCLWDKEFDNCATAEWSHPGVRYALWPAVGYAAPPALSNAPLLPGCNWNCSALSPLSFPILVAQGKVMAVAMCFALYYE